MGWVELAFWYLGVFLAPIAWGLAIKFSERTNVVDDEIRLNRKRVKGGHYWNEKLWNMKGETEKLRQKLLNLLAQGKTDDPSAVIDAVDSCNRMLDELTGLMLMKDPDDD